MPRHLISDAHEWINEIPTVPIYYLAKPQPRERKILDSHVIDCFVTGHGRPYYHMPIVCHEVLE